MILAHFIKTYQMQDNKLIRYLPILLTLSVILGFLFYSQNSTKLTQEDLIMPNMIFSSLFENTENIDISKLQGQRYVLHFYSTWCGYCLQEHKELLHLKNKMPIYGILWKDEARKALLHLKADGNPYKNVGIDPYGEISNKLSIDAIPQTFVIDETGKILFRKKGAFNIQELLKFFNFG